MDGRLALVGREHNRRPLRVCRDIQHARQFFDHSLHQEPVEVDTRQLGMEFTACRHRTIPDRPIAAIGRREGSERPSRRRASVLALEAPRGTEVYRLFAGGDSLERTRLRRGVAAVGIFRVYKKGSKPSAPWRFNFGIEINLHEFYVFRLNCVTFH